MHPPTYPSFSSCYLKAVGSYNLNVNNAYVANSKLVMYRRVHRGEKKLQVAAMFTKKDRGI